MKLDIEGTTAKMEKAIDGGKQILEVELPFVESDIVESPFVEVGQIGTVFYFVFFLVIIPVLGLLEFSLIRTGDLKKGL